MKIEAGTCRLGGFMIHRSRLENRNLQVQIKYMEEKHFRNMALMIQQVETFPKVHAARIGAMIVSGNTRIIAGNSMKTHPFQARFSDHEDKIYLHAEMNVIQKIIRIYYPDNSWADDCTLYICRLAYTNTLRNTLLPANSKPCVGCQRCIAVFGIKNVYYTTGNRADPINFL